MTLLLMIMLVFANPTPAAVAEVGQCDPVDGPRLEWTAEARAETRARVRRACRAAKASPAVCAFADAVVVRESSGRAGVRHVRGERENGLGPMGLSLRWHRKKWPGDDEDPMFCQPEVSFAVAHAIMWRAVTRFHARTLLEVQAIYAGRWKCWTDDAGDRVCRPHVTPGTVAAICSRLAARGHDCRAPVSAKDLGVRVPVDRRREWALRLVNTWTDPKDS